jgi:geranylgeranyl reductase
VIGADGARSNVARQEVPGGDRIPYVIAYHEIIAAPGRPGDYDPDRCDVVYDGRISPDFYGWVFPHGKSAASAWAAWSRRSTCQESHRRSAPAQRSGRVRDDPQGRRADPAETARPLGQWPRCGAGRRCRGVVAPSSGEGIYYAMMGGRVAAMAAAACLASGRAKDLQLARKLFMKEHKNVFKILQSMQNAYYKSDERRERFVSLCHDVDVQRLTFEAYMNKELVKARPLAHVKIGIKNIAHLTGLVRPEAV